MRVGAAVLLVELLVASPATAASLSDANRPTTATV